MTRFVVLRGPGILDHLTVWRSGRFTSRSLCGKSLPRFGSGGVYAAGKVLGFDDSLCRVCRRVASTIGDRDARSR